nr:hypothetical protein [Tanacetum cinerariifolium]
MPNDDDDVFTEATPLARKVPIVDYKIYTKNNKPCYKIIRADGSPQLFQSFLSLLRNFDHEDLEVIWELVKEREKISTYKVHSGSNAQQSLELILLRTSRKTCQDKLIILIDVAGTKCCCWNGSPIIPSHVTNSLAVTAHQRAWPIMVQPVLVVERKSIETIVSLIMYWEKFRDHCVEVEIYSSMRVESETGEVVTCSSMVKEVRVTDEVVNYRYKEVEVKEKAMLGICKCVEVVVMVKLAVDTYIHKEEEVKETVMVVTCRCKKEVVKETEVVGTYKCMGEEVMKTVVVGICTHLEEVVKEMVVEVTCRCKEEVVKEMVVEVTCRCKEEMVKEMEVGESYRCMGEKVMETVVVEICTHMDKVVKTYKCMGEEVMETIVMGICTHMEEVVKEMVVEVNCRCKEEVVKKMEVVETYKCMGEEVMETLVVGICTHMYKVVKEMVVEVTCRCKKEVAETYRCMGEEVMETVVVGIYTRMEEVVKEMVVEVTYIRMEEELMVKVVVGVCTRKEVVVKLMVVVVTCRHMKDLTNKHDAHRDPPQHE